MFYKSVLYAVTLLLTVLLMPVRGASVNIDSLEQQLEHSTGKAQIKIYSDLAWYLRKADPAKAWQYGNKALVSAQIIKDDTGVAQAYNDLGILLFDRSEYDSAISYYNKSLLIREELGDSEGMASVYNKLGIIYQNRRQIDSSIAYALDALAIYDTLGKPMQLSHCINNLGVLYYNSGLYPKSLEYHERALAIRKEMKNPYLIGASFVNLANLQALMKDTLLSGVYYESA
jgi:tetratricopeptide (TPR) repeat protein